MKLRITYLRLLIAALVILAAAGAFAALRKGTAAIPAPPQTFTLPVASKEQLLILQELTTLLHRMDTLTVVTITGSLSAQDLADSSNTLQTDFCYSRQGNTAYYRMGQNEMISLSDAYISVAHDLKRIYLSTPKEVVNPMRMTAGIEADMLGKEGFNVSRGTKGVLNEISLESSTHASCREYHVLFDSTGLIRQTDMRITDPQMPMDKKRDKFIHMTISSWQLGKVRTELLRMDRYITLVDGNPVPAPSLKGYDLVRED